MLSEAELKKRATEQIQDTLGGTVCADNAKASVPRSILNKLRDKRDAANRQAQQAELLNELVHLLEENPAIARILHLLDVTGHS
jgi:hypothetical protein